MNEIDVTLLALAALCLGLYLMIRWLALLIAGALPGRYSAYRQLAQRYRGRCESRGLVDPPTVSFTYDGAQVRVGLAPIVPGQSSVPRTRVVARFARGLPMRLELYPRRRPVPPQNPRGTRDVKLDIPEFDHVYAVQANDAEIARALLVPEGIRQTIDQLLLLCPPAGVLLSVNPERLLIQVDRNLGSNFPALDAMTRVGLILHQHLQTSVAQRMGEGVQVVETALSDTLAGPPACPVCGEPITGPHVTCNACKTPAHAECWKYAGSCPTYGCKEKLATPVR